MLVSLRLFKYSGEKAYLFWIRDATEFIQARLQAEATAEVLLLLINDILDYSKIETGKLSLDNAPFRFSDILKSLWDYVCL